MKIFNINFLKTTNKVVNDKTSKIYDRFDEIGKLVKNARIQKNISIRQLSEISKIPVSSLNAIENNIKDLRPKEPFIRSILLKLEECLSINNNTLVELVIKDTDAFEKSKNKYIIRKFDFLDSWQGSFLYFLVLILTLFILNRYFNSNINIIEIQFIEEQVNESKS